MSLDKIKEFISNLAAHDLPAGAGSVGGLVLLYIVFKTKKLILKLLLLLISVGLFAGAYWWHRNHG